MWREVLIRREKAGRGKSDLALQSIGGDMGQESWAACQSRKCPVMKGETFRGN